MNDSHAEDTVLAPLRDVRYEVMRYPLVVGAFRAITLSCGHVIMRRPAQKVPKRARCYECAKWGDM